MMTARSIDLTKLICEECHRFWPRLVPARWSTTLGFEKPKASRNQCNTKTWFPPSLPSQSESTIKFVPRSTLLSIPHITVVRIGKGGGRLVTWGRWSATSPGRPSLDQPPTNVELRHPYSESLLSRPWKANLELTVGLQVQTQMPQGHLALGRCRG